MKRTINAPLKLDSMVIRDVLGDEVAEEILQQPIVQAAAAVNHGGKTGRRGYNSEDDTHQDNDKAVEEEEFEDEGQRDEVSTHSASEAEEDADADEQEEVDDMMETSEPVSAEGDKRIQSRWNLRRKSPELGETHHHEEASGISATQGGQKTSGRVE